MNRPHTGSWLLVGCGYVGARVATRLRAVGATLAIVTRDAARAAALRAAYDARTCVGDYADADLVRAFCARQPPPLRVLCLLPPGACQDASGTLAPLRRFVSALDELAPVRAVLTSSTGVYGEQGGAVVAAETPCQVHSARERRLFDIEQVWLDGAQHGVVRFAGLYGPGRVIGLTGLRGGRAVPGDPDGWLNLLHVDDAATLLLRATSANAAAIELGADGHPVTRRTYYAALAALANLPSPVFDGQAASRGGGARRCDPASTRARLAWQPMYRDFRAGLAALDEVFNAE